MRPTQTLLLKDIGLMILMLKLEDQSSFIFAESGLARPLTQTPMLPSNLVLSIMLLFLHLNTDSMEPLNHLTIPTVDGLIRTLNTLTLLRLLLIPKLSSTPIKPT